jgi:integrase
LEERSHDSDGTGIHPDVFSTAFVRLVTSSGLPRIRLHDLRHTHATIGLRNGVPVKVISERLGHAQASFTMDVYQHVMPSMQSDAAATIAAAVRGATQSDVAEGASGEAQ